MNPDLPKFGWVAAPVDLLDESLKKQHTHGTSRQCKALLKGTPGLGLKGDLQSKLPLLLLSLRCLLLFLNFLAFLFLFTVFTSAKCCKGRQAACFDEAKKRENDF